MINLNAIAYIRISIILFSLLDCCFSWNGVSVLVGCWYMRVFVCWFCVFGFLFKNNYK